MLTITVKETDSRPHYVAKDNKGTFASSTNIESFLLEVKAHLLKEENQHISLGDILHNAITDSEPVEKQIRKAESRLLSKIAYCGVGHLENNDIAGYMAITNAIAYAEQEK